MMKKKRKRKANNVDNKSPFLLNSEDAITFHRLNELV